MAETTTVEGVDKLDEHRRPRRAHAHCDAAGRARGAARVAPAPRPPGRRLPFAIPPPLNITEIGGYLNLLQELGQEEIRSGAVASALGVAGPPPGAADSAASCRSASWRRRTTGRRAGATVDPAHGHRARGLSRAASDRARGDPGDRLRASTPCAPRRSFPLRNRARRRPPWTTTRCSRRSAARSRSFLAAC